MPRRREPPRLYLYEREGRPAVWIILDGGRQISTGARADDRSTAEEAFENYLGGKRVADFGNGHPTRVRIADALAEYAEKHGPSTRRPDLIGFAVDRLVDFFGAKTVSAITPSSCVEYVTWRTSQRDPRARHRQGELTKPATARRELVVLAAALRWCWKDVKLDRLVPVKLPASPEPRERHLARSEVAALLWGALGFNQDGRRNPYRINRHLARFILIALYTGTRHDAVLKLQWMANTSGGWVDLENGVIYRRPRGAVETAKRRPAVPIPGRLMPHLRRWRRLTARFVIEFKGRPIRSQERRAWKGARELAGLGPEVTPHVLRHSCATMLLQLGVSVYDVAGVLGTSEDVIRRTYGHHAQDHLKKAVAAFSIRQRFANETT